MAFSHLRFCFGYSSCPVLNCEQYDAACRQSAKPSRRRRAKRGERIVPTTWHGIECLRLKPAACVASGNSIDGGASRSQEVFSHPAAPRIFGQVFSVLEIELTSRFSRASSESILFPPPWAPAPRSRGRSRARTTPRRLSNLYRQLLMFCGVLGRFRKDPCKFETNVRC